MAHHSHKKPNSHTAFSAHIQTRYSSSTNQSSDSMSFYLLFMDGGLQSMWDDVDVAHSKPLFLLELETREWGQWSPVRNSGTLTVSVFWEEPLCRMAIIPSGQRKQSTVQKQPPVELSTPKRCNIRQCINQTYYKLLINEWWNISSSVNDSV